MSVERRIGDRGAMRAASLRLTAFGSPSVVLFLVLFASQAGVLVLSPVLGDVAAEFDVSIATAGQLRIVAVPLAVVAALLVARWLARVSSRSLLAAGAALLALGSVASAAAPSFAALALAQIPVWTGTAVLVGGGIAAAASWSAPERRSRVVAHALAGPPAAWIIGMPLIGLAAEVSWRLSFLVLPLPAALLAGVALATRPADAPSTTTGASLASLLRRAGPRRWVVGELMANSAWAGTLVFSGALLTEVHGTSPTVAGLGLAAVAAAFLLGNLWSGRRETDRTRGLMLEASLAAAVAVALTWAVTPDVVTTLVLFSAAAFMAAARTVFGTVYGFQVAGEADRAVGAVRAVTTQLGYLVGSLVGGVALAVGGFDALAVAYGGLFVAAVAPYVCVRRECRARGALLADA
jgi:DHA1 family inner membrane transport protein